MKTITISAKVSGGISPNDRKEINSIMEACRSKVNSVINKKEMCAVQVVEDNADYLHFKNKDGINYQIQPVHTGFAGKNIYLEVLEDLYGVTFNINSPNYADKLYDARMSLSNTDFLKWADLKKDRWENIEAEMIPLLHDMELK